MKYLVLLIIGLLVINGLYAQKKINEADIHVEYGYYSDISKNPLTGPYEVIGEGFNSIAYFDHTGQIHGFYRTFYDGKLKYESEYFLGIALSDKEFDRKGNLIEQHIYRRLEILEGTRNKFGGLNTGKVKIINLSNQDKYGDYSEISVKNMQRDGVCSEYKKSDLKLSDYIYSNGVQNKVVIYLPTGEILKELPARSKFELSKYPNKFTSYFDYKIKQLGNNQFFWTDTLGNPLNGNYDFYFGNTYDSDLRTLKNGYPHGVQYNFNESGFLQSIKSYESGVLNGSVVEINGGDITTKNYRDGKQHGLHLEYDYSNGVITDSVYYKNGLKTGTQQIRQLNGKISQKVSYKNGKKQGKIETYQTLQNGKRYLSKVEIYQYGNKYGNHMEYDSIGNIIKQESYKFNRLHGKSIDNSSNEDKFVSLHKLGKQIAHTSYKKDGIKNWEWYIEGRKHISLNYYLNGKPMDKTQTIQWDSKRLPGDSIHVWYYNKSESLTKEKIALVDESTDLSDPCCYWLYHYNKNQLSRTEFVTEDYPNQTTKVYENSLVVRVINGPIHPDNNQKRKILYLNKQGETIKTCYQIYFDESEYDGIVGIWQDETCN